jgi:hypothetical protein
MIILAVRIRKGISMIKSIADKMVKGITKESAQIAEIGQVLVAEGLIPH